MGCTVSTALHWNRKLTLHSIRTGPLPTTFVRGTGTVYVRYVIYRYWYINNTLYCRYVGHCACRSPHLLLIAAIAHLSCSIKDFLTVFRIQNYQFWIWILKMKIRNFGSGSFCKIVMVKKVLNFGYITMKTHLGWNLQLFNFSTILCVIMLNLITFQYISKDMSKLGVKKRRIWIRSRSQIQIRNQ